MVRREILRRGVVHTACEGGESGSVGRLTLPTRNTGPPLFPFACARPCVLVCSGEMDSFQSFSGLTPAEEVLLLVVQRLTGLPQLDVAKILAESAVEAVASLKKNLVIVPDDDRLPWDASIPADLVIKKIEALRNPQPGVN